MSNSIISRILRGYLYHDAKPIKDWYRNCSRLGCPNQVLVISPSVLRYCCRSCSSKAEYLRRKDYIVQYQREYRSKNSKILAKKATNRQKYNKEKYNEYWKTHRALRNSPKDYRVLSELDWLILQKFYNL